MTYKSIDLNSVAASTNDGTRLYALSHGDAFVLNNVAIKQAFDMTIKKIKLGKKINDHFICTEKIKRKHWWQFWKPKYWGAKFVYVDRYDILDLDTFLKQEGMKRYDQLRYN